MNSENGRISIQTWVTILLGMSYAVMYAAMNNNFPNRGNKNSVLRVRRLSPPIHPNGLKIDDKRRASEEKKQVKWIIMSEIRNYNQTSHLQIQLQSWAFLKPDKIILIDKHELIPILQQRTLEQQYKIEYVIGKNSRSLEAYANSSYMVLWLKESVVIYEDIRAVIIFAARQPDDILITIKASREVEFSAELLTDNKMNFTHRIQALKLDFPRLQPAVGPKNSAFIFKASHLNVNSSSPLPAKLSYTTKLIDASGAVSCISILPSKDTQFNNSLGNNQLTIEDNEPDQALEATWALFHCTVFAEELSNSPEAAEATTPCLLHRTLHGLKLTRNQDQNLDAYRQHLTLPTLSSNNHSSISPNSAAHGPAWSEFSRKTGKQNEEATFADLVRQRADQNRTVVLMGFNFGYRELLVNMACRLGQLGVENYLAAAFDEDSHAFCKGRRIPCFAAFEGTNITAAQVFGSKEFQALTKLKSLQVCSSFRKERTKSVLFLFSKSVFPKERQGL